jgi:hypothetical protein
MPRHATELKKYFSGIGPVSRTCDNEHTLASLGQAEILSVEDTPCGIASGARHHACVCPSGDRYDGRISPNQRSEEAAEGIVFGAEDSGDVFENDNSRVDCIYYLHET